MADRWMDERDREWRDRDWKRSEQQFGRDPQSRERRDEDRSFQSFENGGEAGGEDFSRGSRITSGGGAYGAGGSYGGGESYGRGSGGGRPASYRGQSSGQSSGQTSNQSAGQAFNQQDYTQGGRFLGDDRRQPIYREEYGQGGREYGAGPRGYDAGRQGTSSYDSGYQRRMGPAQGDFASGGTGGYDYERGYGDAGRREFRGDRDRWMDHERHAHEHYDRGGHHEEFEDRAREAGQSLRGVGQKISSWFRGDHYMEGSRPDERRDRSFREDFGRERRVEPQGRGYRGLGPKNYKRSDERINEEVHERLTDDPWIDASDIHVQVDNGEVTLSGTVDNRETKHRAERLVEDLSGVTHVQNNLRVTQGAGPMGSGRGFGSSALEAEMRRNEPTTDTTGSAMGSATGVSGRTSTGALSERSAGTATDGSETSASGQKKQ